MFASSFFFISIGLLFLVTSWTTAWNFRFLNGRGTGSAVADADANADANVVVAGEGVDVALEERRKRDREERPRAVPALLPPPEYR